MSRIVGIEILVTSEDIVWALQTAQESMSRWESKPGFYNNRFNSHFKGKLGELAVEALINDRDLPNTPHFRFADREELCDIEIHASSASASCRIEVKTWSSRHWDSLGRCVSVTQFKYLRKKADRIIWGIVEEVESLNPAHLRDLDIIAVDLSGWSTMEEVEKAPIRNTGHKGMRKVTNYQLEPDMLNSMESF